MAEGDAKKPESKVMGDPNDILDMVNATLAELEKFCTAVKTKLADLDEPFKAMWEWDQKRSKELQAMLTPLLEDVKAETDAMAEYGKQYVEKMEAFAERLAAKSRGDEKPAP